MIRPVIVCVLYFSLAQTLTSCGVLKTKDRVDLEALKAQEDQTSNEGGISEEENEATLDLGIDSEVSLKEDRAHLEELRKEIPIQTQKKNDELAYILSLMKEGARNPNDIRQKFQRHLRKKRDQFNKKMRQSRKQFTKNERKRRDSFLKNQKKEREDFKDRKNSSKEEIREFYNAQEEKRREFFENEREHRREYESEMRALSIEFNASYREKSRDVNEELKIYSQDYRDRKTMKNKLKILERRKKQRNRNQINQPSEFDQMKNVPEEEL